MNTQKGFAPILTILLVVVVIGGGVYFYTQNSLGDINNSSVELDNSLTITEDATSDDNQINNEIKQSIVYDENKIKINNLNSDETIQYDSLRSAGDLAFGWSGLNDYIPTDNFEAHILDSENKIVKKWNGLKPTRFTEDSYWAEFVGTEGIIPNREYKIEVCDSYKGIKYCDQTNKYFTITGLNVSETSIYLNDYENLKNCGQEKCPTKKFELSINDFADEIQVSKDASFGSSDKIKEAKLSPNDKWVAISISGAAHDFGWLYNVDTKVLRPVVFSYGGGVSIKGWKSNEEVIFTITSPKPDAKELIININNLLEYPRIAK